MPAAQDAVWIDVLPSMRRFAPALASEVAKPAEQAGKQASSRMAGALKVGLLGAAGAIGAALSKGVADNISIGQVNDKLAAQLGLSARESGRVGKLAGNLYRDAYGGSLEEVNSALRGVQTNIGDLGKFSNAEIEGMGAKALDLASIMGEDVSRVTRGVGQLIRNGLAPDAEAGFDIVTAAAQRLPESMQGELLDTIEEYGADLSQLGLTGEQAFGALSSAVDAGARNVDLAADAFREFSIRAIDGSDATVEGFQLLGLNADDMAKRIAEGGPTATKATSEIIRALANTSDPIKQEAAGVALFGTRFEELGIGAVSAMDPLAASLGDVSGATDKMGETLNDNFGTRLEGWKRSAAGFAQDGIMAVVRGFESGESSASGWQGALQRVGAAIADGVEDLKAFVKWVDRNRETLTNLGIVVAGAITLWKTYTLTVAAQAAVQRGIIGVTKAWAAAQALLNGTLALNPIGLVVVALVALVGGLVLAYKRSETFRKVVNAAWDGVKKGWDALWNKALKPGFAALVKWVTDTIPGAFRKGVQWVKDRWTDMRGKLTQGWLWIRSRVFEPLQRFVTRTIPDAFRRGVAFVKSRWDSFRDLLRAGWQWVVRFVFDPVRRLVTSTLPGYFQVGVRAVQRWWGRFSSNIRAGWDFVKRTVWNPAKTFITETLPGYFRTAVNFVGRIWGAITDKVAGPIRTIKTWINNNLIDPLNKVTKIFGLTIPKLAAGGVVRPVRVAAVPQPLATGGLLRGPGTGTSDSILGVDASGVATARVSHGEFVVNAAATRKHLGLLTAINAGVSPGAAGSRGGAEVPGFFLGGLIDKAMNKVTGWLAKGAEFATNSILGPARALISRAVPSPDFANRIATGSVDKLKDIIGEWVDKKEKAQQAANGPMPTGSFNGRSGIGWQWQMSVLRSVFPGLALNSGYRPGAITALGNRSMHGLGRAVDVPPMMSVFNWIRSNFPRSAQLFFSPAGGRQLLNGRNWYSDPVTRAGHWDHVHWGYDQGGQVPPRAARTIVNATRKPEALLNPQQWSDISTLAQRGSGPAGPTFGDLVAVDPRAIATEVMTMIRRSESLRAGVI